MKNKGDRLNKGQKLYRNEYLISKNKQYVLVMQGDGNLVHKAVWQPGSDVNWNAHTDNEGVRTVMQGDGNLCVYDHDNDCVWDSETDGKGLYVVVENGGRCRVYGKNNHKEWETPQAPKFESIDIDCKFIESLNSKKYDWDLISSNGKILASGKENTVGLEFSAAIDGTLSIKKGWLPRIGQEPKMTSFVGLSAGLLIQVETTTFLDKNKNPVGTFSSTGFGIGYSGQGGGAIWWPVN